MKYLKRLTALLLTFIMVLGIPISANAIQDWYGVSDPLQYTSDLHIGNYTYRAGTYSTVMRLDETNRIAYCIQPDVQIGGNESDWFYETVSSTPAWNALSLNQQTAINLLLLYGYPNQSLPGNKPEQYFATRNMIWEIVMGYRDSTHPYTRRDARCYNAFSGHAGFVQAYKELEKKLTTHYLRPSFSGRSAMSAPTIILDYNPSTKKYEKTVTDTNNVLSSFNFSISGVTLSRNGNTLSISTANKITAGAVFSSTKPLPSPASTGILIWQSVNNPSGNQNMITGGGAGDPVPAYFKLAIGEGTVQIRKTDDTHGGFFSGAVYGIYDSGGTKVDELTTSAADYVKSKPLPLGHYYLQELKAPSGAILDTTKHEFDLTTNGATLSLSVSDQSQTANILITKQGEVLTGATQSDSEFGPLYTPTYGLSALSGAVYDIYANENIVSAGGKQLYTKDQLVCTVNSGAKSPNLPLGQYRAVEKTAPSGFALDTTPHIIDLTYKGQTVTVYTEPVTVTNQRQKVTVSLKKFIEENALFPNPDAYKDIRFGIFSSKDIQDNSGNTVIPKNSLLDIFGIDETLQGSSSADLPISDYYLKELQTAPGWVLDETEYPFSFSAQPQDVQHVIVEPNGGQPISNETVKGYVEIYKSDATYGGALANAVYGIYTTNGTQAGSLTTDLKGYDKSGPLPRGSYYLQEISAPEGTVLDPKQYPFTISEQDAVITIHLENISQQANVLITKEGERLTNADQSETEFGIQYTPVYGTETLSGAVYEIYANQDIYSPGGILLYSAGELIATVNGGEISPDLPLGQIRIQEKTVPEGFVLDTTPHIVDLTYKGQNVTVYTEPVTVTNQRQKVTVTLTKLIEENPIFPNPDAYKDIRFGIFTAQDFKDSSGNVVIPQNSLVDIISLDESLKGVSSADLPIGSYYLKELQTAPGWVLNETIYPFTFEAQPQEIQEITIDPSNGEPIVNNTVKGFIEIIKKSVLPETHKGLFVPSGLPVGEAVYGIFTLDDIKVGEMTLNESGYAKSTLIPHGNYYVAELVPPFGMELDLAKYPVSIQEDGEVISVESTDIAKLGTVTGFYQDTGGGDGLDVAPIVKEPKPLTPTISTGDHTFGFIIFLTAAAGGSPLLLLLFRKKKKSRLFPVLFLVLSLLFLTSCGGISDASVSETDGGGTSSALSSGAETPQAPGAGRSITREQEFVTTSEDFNASFQKTLEQPEGSYSLKDIEYTVLSEKKLEEPVTVTQQVEYFGLLEQNAKAPSAITIDADGESVTGKLIGIDYTPIIITGRETSADAYTDYGLDVNEPKPPQTKEIAYADPQTGKTVSAVLDFDHLETLDGFSWRSDVTIPLTFSYYDSFGYVLGDAFIPYNEEIPAMDGFESVLLDSLGLNPEQYRITGFQWTGEPYEENGVMYRNAEASGQRYAASYRAVYSGTVSLPDVPGYDAVATYTGTVQQPTGETEYTVKAVASYERLESEEKAEIPSQPGTGLTPIQIVFISVGAFLFLVLIVGLLWILAKQKKKKQTKKEF